MTNPTPASSSRRGFALISALLILVVITMLGLSMFRSIGMQEKMAGNTREKQRAFQAAQTALQYGEWWLGAGNGSTGINCTGVVDGNTVAQMRVCANPLTGQTTLPWSVRTDYLPPGMTISTSGGLNGSGDINYFAKPGLYVSYLGLNPTGDAALYQVTAFGYGGGTDQLSSTSTPTASTASVVQSTYAITSSVKNLGTP